MPFEFNPELGPERPRTKTIFISVGLHALVILLLVLNPEWLDLARVVRVEGEEIDLERSATMLLPPPALPPVTAPPPVMESAPPPDAVPAPVIPAPPKPIPPPAPLPVPPPPAMPPAVIRPDDLIAEGARPDAPPRPSRGNTPDPARMGALTPPTPLPLPMEPPGPPPAPAREPEPPPVVTAPPGPKVDAPSPAAPPGPGSPRGTLQQLATNSNSNALRLPSLGGGRTSVDNAIQNAVNSPPRPSGSGTGRTGNGRGLELPNFSAEEPRILSNTRGYDFGPYLNQVVNRVRVNWYSLIPESVRYNGQRGRVVLTFTIVKSGAVQDLTLRLHSGADPLDRAAMGSITASNPFQRLPSNFEGDHLTLQFTFLYNIAP